MGPSFTNDDIDYLFPSIENNTSNDNIMIGGNIKDTLKESDIVKNGINLDKSVKDSNVKIITLDIDKNVYNMIN